MVTIVLAQQAGRGFPLAVKQTRTQSTADPHAVKLSFLSILKARWPCLSSLLGPTPSSAALCQHGFWNSVEPCQLVVSQFNAIHACTPVACPGQIPGADTARRTLRATGGAFPVLSTAGWLSPEPHGEKLKHGCSQRKRKCLLLS